MADGDDWTFTRTATHYQSDQGPDFRRKVPDGYVAQAGLGWVAGNGNGVSSMPRGFKPRCVICEDQVTPGLYRRVVVGTAAAYDAIVVDTTTFAVYDSISKDEQTYIVRRKEGERARG